MPSDRRERSGSAGSAKSAASRASSSMGKDGGEVGRRMAAEDELIRRELQDPTTFCNSFWGSNDAGYPVIQSRMKSSAKIIEDVRLMYKERSEIEQEYAKRLAKLSKQQFGKDETGSMKHALEMVRGEIEQTAKTHADLSLVFKRDLEGQLGEFQNRIQSQRKTTLTNIEKLYKQKTTQESYVNKSKDKYEQDCIRINGYTAQSSLVQGRDLEKVTSKLDKAQSTVNGNDKDYQNFVRALKDTTLRWNSEWKSYLDQCQDLEEERLEFLKSNLWNYANSISAVCVADDQSCERVRVSLESCEAPRDIIDFIQRAGTGSAIPDPPDYINYSRGQPPPTRPTFKTAAFHRTSTRPPTFIAPIAPVKTNPSSSAGGDSAGMIQSDSRGEHLPAGDMSGLTNDFSRQTISDDQDRQNNGRPPPGGVALPGMTNSQSITNANTAPLGDDSIGGDSSAAMRTNKSDKRMSAKNFLARTPSRGQSGMGNTKPGGGNANGGGSGGMQSMQSITSSSQRSGGMTNSDTSGTMGTTIIKPAPPLTNERADDDDGGDGNDDPIARALADLRNKPNRSPAPQQNYTQPSQPVGKQQPYGNLGGQRGVVNDYPTENRARSPSAAFMQEPERATSPLPVEEVVGQYGQSFPGERRTLSRQNSNTSRHSRMSMHAPQSVQQTHERSRSPGPQNDGAGFAGVGARGRSPSPQPFQQAPIQQQQVRSPQKQPAQASQQNQFAQKPPMQSRPSGQPKPNTFGTPQRSTTPLGISLDASGSVTHDQMADDFIRRTGSVGPQQGRAMTPQQPQQQPQQAYQASGLPPHMQQQQAAPVQGAYGHPSHPSQQSTYSAQQYSNAPPQSQQSTPVRQGYGGGAAGGPYTPVQGTPGGYQQTPPPGSLGRQGGTPFAGAAAAGGTPGYQSPSPYNQRPASATAPTVGMPPPDRQSTPAGQAYMQPQQQQQQQQQPYQAPQQQMYAQQQVPPPQAHQETPASAYMHQYQQQQQQHQPPQPQAQQGAPYGQQWQSQAPQGHNPIVPQGGQLNGGVPTSQYSGGGVHQPVAQIANTGNPSNATAARPPTGQYSDAGKPILFYVKALYDYEAQLQEEFSFTAGDVIAVWETNADGWWQGELLDDARRRQNSNTFPSNFVSLLN